MMFGRLVRASLWFGGCCLLAGCAIPAWVPLIGQNPDLRVQAVRSIKSVQVRRIAVMPLIDQPTSSGEVAEGSTDTVTAEVLGQMSLDAGWEVVPEADVQAAMQKMPPVNLNNQAQVAQQLGKKLSADGIILGTLDRFKERVGLDYAAASPAAVDFTLHLLDVNSGQIVWTAKFVKQQKALTENIFNLANFLENSGRWVKAHEIAQEGVREAVNDLHGQLNLEQNVKRFPSGSYEQYRSGVERFNRNPL